MNVINNIANHLYIGKYRIAPGATQVVPDAEYNSEDILASIINAAYAAGTINVTSPPSPFPRSGVHTGATGSSTASELAFVPVGTIAATNVQDAIAEAASEAGSSSGVGDKLSLYTFTR